MLNTDLPYLTENALNHFIGEALREDIGSGDVSSLSSVPAGRISRAELKVKDSGILAGVQLAGMIFSRLDPELEMDIILQDGSRISPGQIAFTVRGSAISILSAERLVLNCMQRMSGVATRTRHLQDMISHTKARVLDTRKTSPNSRIIEKWAVAIGGGKNHRYALYDMVMLKDNHIDYAGGITAALKACHQYLKENHLSLKIEVETRNLDELQEALDSGLADVIMLDNYNLEDMRQAVKMTDGKIPLEASGNIREETIVAVAESGVDYISVGALTHSYKSLDLSLKAVKE
jgi:nicotinate-nucleotide pyrophosphorylase (carboxylating)